MVEWLRCLLGTQEVTQLNPFDSLFVVTEFQLKLFRENSVATQKSRWFTSVVTVNNEVAKVMFLQVSVCPQGGWYPSIPCRWYPSMPCIRSPRGGFWSGGVWSGGGVCSRGGVCSLGGVCSRRSWYPSIHPWKDGYCCGQYASHWNAFLFILQCKGKHFKDIFLKKFLSLRQNFV